MSLKVHKETIIDSDIEYMIAKIEAVTETKLTRTVVELAEEKRIFPEGSPYPGPCSFDRTPYMREIALECSPQSATEEIIFMKAGQIGGTAMSAENLILFCIEEDPSPVLYVTANDELARKWAQTTIEPMIEGAGLTHKLKATVQKSANKATGNTTLNKTWAGGKLDVLTYGKIDQLRSISYKIIILDEEETAVNATQKGVKQGKFRDVAFARTRTFSGRRKILRISTPLIKQYSEIFKAFLTGDQRYYNIPCPHCNHKQKLEWRFLRYETVDRIVIPETVHYECQNPECGKGIRNAHKSIFLNHGEWIPENKNPKSKTRSYQLSAMYAPIGMDTWEVLAQMWVDAQASPEEVQVFYNMCLGLPYEEQTDTPAPEMLHALKGSYFSGEMPPKEEGGILFTTVACDVQAGNMREGKVINPPRIELEILGHGEGFRTWSLGYHVLEGATTHYNGGAFSKLRDMIANRKFGAMHPVKIFIDSGYQPDVVRQFCQGSIDVHPIMGDSIKTIKKMHFKEEALIEYQDGNGDPLKWYKINTNPLKRITYNNLLLRKNQEGEYLDGHCMFPQDYGQKYFEMLTAEHQVQVIKNGSVVGFEFDSGGRRNEAIDIRVYNLAASEVHAFMISSAAGYEAINWRLVWEYYKNGCDLVKALRTIK
jgi:phage terminase large subunit GpA-like protein